LIDDIGEGYITYTAHVTFARPDIMMLVDLLKQNGKTYVDVYSRLKIGYWKKSIQTLEYGAKGIPGCP